MLAGHRYPVHECVDLTLDECVKNANSAEDKRWRKEENDTMFHEVSDDSDSDCADVKVEANVHLLSSNGDEDEYLELDVALDEEYNEYVMRNEVVGNGGNLRSNLEVEVFETEPALLSVSEKARLFSQLSVPKIPSPYGHVRKTSRGTIRHSSSYHHPLLEHSNNAPSNGSTADELLTQQFKSTPSFPRKKYLDPVPEKENIVNEQKHYLSIPPEQRSRPPPSMPRSNSNPEDIHLAKPERHRRAISLSTDVLSSKPPTHPKNHNNPSSKSSLNRSLNIGLSPRTAQIVAMDNPATRADNLKQRDKTYRTSFAGRLGKDGFGNGSRKVVRSWTGGAELVSPGSLNKEMFRSKDKPKLRRLPTYPLSTSKQHSISNKSSSSSTSTTSSNSPRRKPPRPAHNDESRQSSSPINNLKESKHRRHRSQPEIRQTSSPRSSTRTNRHERSCSEIPENEACYASSPTKLRRHKSAEEHRTNVVRPEVLIPRHYSDEIHPIDRSSNRHRRLRSDASSPRNGRSKWNTRSESPPIGSPPEQRRNRKVDDDLPDLTQSETEETIPDYPNLYDKTNDESETEDEYDEPRGEHLINDGSSELDHTDIEHDIYETGSELDDFDMAIQNQIENQSFLSITTPIPPPPLEDIFTISLPLEERITSSLSEHTPESQLVTKCVISGESTLNTENESLIFSNRLEESKIDNGDGKKKKKVFLRFFTKKTNSKERKRESKMEDDVVKTVCACAVM